VGKPPHHRSTVELERDGSTLSVQKRGTWVCVTLAREDAGRAKDILLSADEAEHLAAWLIEHGDQ